MDKTFRRPSGADPPRTGREPPPFGEVVRLA